MQFNKLTVKPEIILYPYPTPPPLISLSAFISPKSRLTVQKRATE